MTTTLTFPTIAEMFGDLEYVEARELVSAYQAIGVTVITHTGKNAQSEAVYGSLAEAFRVTRESIKEKIRQVIRTNLYKNQITVGQSIVWHVRSDTFDITYVFRPHN